jgi:hypothetical protein
MLRFALILVLFFVALGLLRVIRGLLVSVLGGGAPGAGPRQVSGQEMVRDPICGAWIDRRLALTGRRGGELVPVCSEKCRLALEAQ